MAETGILLSTAISIAIIHTLIGFDHYIPFIALSQANKWSMKKTMLIVLLCGIGHVLSSVLIGIIGIALSSALSFLTDIENIRSAIATYFLIAFGLVYTIFGIRQAVKNKSHTHIHNGNSFWGLFIFLVLGPCEPLIPVIMYPAATLNIYVLILVTLSFAICTIAVMLLMTFLGIKGIRFLKMEKLGRYSHLMAGLAILICGISVWLMPI